MRWVGISSPSEISRAPRKRLPVLRAAANGAGGEQWNEKCRQAPLSSVGERQRASISLCWPGRLPRGDRGDRRTSFLRFSRLHRALAKDAQFSPIQVSYVCPGARHCTSLAVAGDGPRCAGRGSFSRLTWSIRRLGPARPRLAENPPAVRAPGRRTEQSVAAQMGQVHRATCDSLGELFGAADTAGS